MRKVKNILVVFVLLMATAFGFVGCGEEVDTNFYVETSTKFSDFIETVCLNSDYQDGVTYEERVSGILAKIEDGTITNENSKLYTELKTVYDSIFVSSFHFLQTFSLALSVAPSQENLTVDAQEDYADFTTQIDVTLDAFDQFKISLHQFDIQVNTQNPFDITSLQVLKDYKRDIIDLCLEIVKLDNMFISLCENYVFTSYSTFVDQNGEYLELNDTELTNQKNLANLKSVVATITPAIEYLNAFDGSYVALENDKLFTTLEQYSQIDIASDSSTLTATVEELQQFLTVYNYYQNDVELFYTSLENVDFHDFAKCNFDPVVYAENDAQSFAYASKILTFIDQGVENLYTVNSALCE